MKQFQYRKAFKIIYWGCSFDSLLELKFALSIYKEYEFLRSRLSVYYNPASKQPTNYITTGTRRYTPDFLIRNKHTNQAFWIEIKPRAFSNSSFLSLRKEVAENYIRWKKYDWTYRVVYDDEIVLNGDQQKEFDYCLSLKSKSAFKIKFRQQNNRFDRSAPLFFSSVPRESTVRFVMFGRNN